MPKMNKIYIDTYRMCSDSGWTYDKQNISLVVIELQIANKFIFRAKRVREF